MRNRTIRAFAKGVLTVGVLLGGVGAGRCAEPGPDDVAPCRVYAVGRKVSDFPAQEDMSTPEAAYAALHRAYVAEGEQAFVRLSVPRLRARIAAAPQRPCPKERIAENLTAEAVEVHVWNDTHAAVLGHTQGSRGSRWEIRNLERVDGRWLNCGHDAAATLEEIRQAVTRERNFARMTAARNERPGVAEPAAYLRPFTEFLKTEGRDPQAFVLEALARHRVTILGEVHHRPRYWAFDAALVRAPEFAARTGVVYLELPAHAQPLVDAFLAADRYDPQPVTELLRDMMEFGWPDQPMLDFFRTVWESNRPRSPAQRIRLVLVDMPRPWAKIRRREDWRAYDTDRNQCMAENIVRDLEAHAADSRHALFIVGYAHAMLDLHLNERPFPSAGRLLREKLGAGEVCAVFPHSPVLSNSGPVHGRLALGLFDTALAQTGYRPVAFPLDHGPFGELLYDADADFLTAEPYRKAFDAFLSLGPLEDEEFSPLIPGFYTDDYAREVDRRYRLMYGRGMKESGELKDVSGAAVVAWLGQTWGRPRRDWADRLGPTNAWHYGSHWEDLLRKERHARALAHPEEIRAAAQRLFDALRAADYTRDWTSGGEWQNFPAADIDYTVHSDYPGWVAWVCREFKTNPVTEVVLGQVSAGRQGMPAIHFDLRRKDGSVLAGELPFRWDPYSGRWGGQEALDWHRHPPAAGPKEK